MKILVSLSVILLIVPTVVHSEVYTLQFNATGGDGVVLATVNTDSRELLVERNGKLILRILMGSDLGSIAHYEQLDNGFNLRNADGEETEFTVEEDSAEFALFTVARKVRHGSTKVTDCVDLALGGSTNWFGGPMLRYQYWPIQKVRLSRYVYLPKEEGGSAIAERYWLNSRGSFVFVEDEVPLWVDQNYGQPGWLCLEARKALPYDVHDSTYSFVYRIGVGRDAKEVHLGAVRNVLGKPSGYPAEEMVRYPVWSTWARYKTEIDENVLYNFAEEIYRNGWMNGQIEIDDDWEMCYGSLAYNRTKFPRMKHTVGVLKAKGFPRVTLWMHPFINKGCEPVYSEAKLNGFLVADHDGNTETSWWNSGPGESAHIDFTKPEAAEWFAQRVANISEDVGVDGFKFDAGEPAFLPADPVLNGPRSKHPLLITSSYLRTVAKFGSLTEVRTAWRTQDLPIFVRMNDKFSLWNWQNGLPTLITTLLMMNMVGYPFVLPDMVGGNGYYGQLPSKEMFIRWLQANVFMPSIQFSYVPWDYDAETVEIAKKMTDLHEKFAPQIMERFRLAVSEEYPVNPPVWWVSPDDEEAQKVDDQFLLGDNILAAPVVLENVRARDIYLPEGEWVDGNIATVYVGPRWIRNYSVPLNILPYFIRKETNI